MRSRLLLSTLAAATVAVLLLGLPLAFAVRTLLTSRALDELQRQAELTAAVATQPSIDFRELQVLLAGIAAETSSTVYLVDRADGIALRAGDVVVPDGFDADLRRAFEGDVGRATGDGLIAVSVPVRVSGLDQVLRIVDTDDALRRSVRRSLLAVGGLAVAALIVAAGVALAQARRLGQPLEELASSARRLGDGDFSARAPRSGIPEPDDVAAALDQTAGRLATLVQRSRSFGADASHQLRTPLTALRLDLEALEAAGADPELLAAAYAEADRLGDTITELLALAEPPAGAETVDLTDLSARRLDAWRALAQAAGRRVDLHVETVPPVRARAAAVGQALQVLLDNALEHGAGTITVSVHATPGGVRLCVADEGPGVPPALEDDLGHGQGADGSGAARLGRGLPLARSLVEAEGGRLRLERARPGAILCLVLPAATT